MTIIRNVVGMELKIELSNEEIEQIVRECAQITVKPVQVTQVTNVTEPVPESAATEPDAKQYTMPKVIRTGCFKDHKEEVMEMLERGMSRHKIAAYFGTTDATVRRWVERWRVGTDVTRKGGVAHLTLDDGFDMMRKSACGMTNAQIAAIYGIAGGTVTHWINKAKRAVDNTAA